MKRWNGLEEVTDSKIIFHRPIWKASRNEDILISRSTFLLLKISIQKRKNGF